MDKELELKEARGLGVNSRASMAILQQHFHFNPSLSAVRAGTGALCHVATWATARNRFLDISHALRARTSVLALCGTLQLLGS